jgi:hypothetical protein
MTRRRIFKLVLSALLVMAIPRSDGGIVIRNGWILRKDDT